MYSPLVALADGVHWRYLIRQPHKFVRSPPQRCDPAETCGLSLLLSRSGRRTRWWVPLPTRAWFSVSVGRACPGERCGRGVRATGLLRFPLVTARLRGELRGLGYRDSLSWLPSVSRAPHSTRRSLRRSHQFSRPMRPSGSQARTRKRRYPLVGGPGCHHPNHGCVLGPLRGSRSLRRTGQQPRRPPRTSPSVHRSVGRSRAPDPQHRHDHLQPPVVRAATISGCLTDALISGTTDHTTSGHDRAFCVEVNGLGRQCYRAAPPSGLGGRVGGVARRFVASGGPPPP